MAAKRNPAAELAEKMVQALKAQRDLGGNAYPLTLKQLAEIADPSAADDLRTKAAKTLTKNSAVVLAQKKHPDTPLALAEDLNRLAESRLLLEWLLEQVCTPKAPAQPVDKVVKKADETLRDPLRKAIQEGTLPETVGAVTLKGKPHLYLQRMPPRKDPVVELAEKLVQALQRRRDQGGTYPVSLRQLAAEEAPGADPKLVRKALGDTAKVITVGKDDEAPVALAGDGDRLADSTAVLDYALAKACTPKKRTVTVEQVVKMVSMGAQVAFEASLRRRLEDGTLPDSAGTLTLGQETVLYRTALSPEGPVVLAAKMLSALRARRAQGGDAYPATLSQLVQTAQPGAAADLVHKATAEKSFKAAAVLRARTGSGPLLLDFVLTAAAAPVVLKGDEDLLAASPALLRYMVASVRTDSNQALPATDLKKKLAKPLQATFAQAVHQCLTTGTLPPGIGALRIKKKEHLFLLADVLEMRNAESGMGNEDRTVFIPHSAFRTPHSAEFPRDFEEAYARLDHQKGGNDFVSLVDLRRALPYDRETFDGELRKLRRAGLFTLSTAEGRHGLSAEEQQAAIREEGTLLLSVSRKRN